MLIAKYHQGLLNTVEQTAQQLLALQNNTFFCPQCGKRVILKIGTKITPHFAHQSKRCTGFTEGESAIHLLGKQQLYKWLQSFGYVELEPLLPALMQRPDILVTIKDQQYAIEFQCSPISVEQLTRRTEGYQQQNIIPIWLFLTPPLPQRMTKYPLKKMYKAGMQFTTQHIPFLMFYHPHTQKFTYLTNILALYGKQHIVKPQYITLNRQQFPFFIPSPLSTLDEQTYTTIFMKAKQQYLQNEWRFGKRHNNILFLSCYTLRISLFELPEYIGVPTAWQSVLPFPVVWQSALHATAKLNDQTIYDVELEPFLQRFTNHIPIAMQEMTRYLSRLNTEHNKKLTDYLQ